MHTLSILIVDDHEVLRKGIRTLLTGRRSWTICGEATTAQEAITKTAKLKPDLVLLDLSLPDVNGLEAIPKIRKAHPRVEILVLTMDESGHMVTQALSVGVRCIVLKCDAARELIAAVEAASQHQMFLSSRVTQAIVKMGANTEGTTGPSLVGLTSREKDVLKLLASGKNNKEIAAMLGISSKTVETHRANTMRKLNLRSLSDLIYFAIRNRIVQT